MSDWRQRLLELAADAEPEPVTTVRGQTGEAEAPYRDFEPTFDRPGDPIDEAALKAHRRDPHLLPELVEACLRMRRAGLRHWSIKAAFEVVRYNATITQTGRTYKLNNNHARVFVRWIIRDYPELADFFETRETARVPQAYDE